MLIYGIAEASTAYLITKITAPPPPPQGLEEFRKRDVKWENKHEFLSLPLEAMDMLNVKAKERAANQSNVDGIGQKQFS